MNFTDFVQVYTHMAVCRLINTSIFSFQKTWHEMKFYGQWGRSSAGGCINNKDTFLRNPQVNDSTQSLFSRVQEIRVLLLL